MPFHLALFQMICISDIIRVPTGKRGGAYKSTPPEELMAFLLRKVYERNHLQEEQIEILLGNSIGTLGNMARNAAIRAGLPDSLKSTTIDFQCGGTYEAIRLARALCYSEVSPIVIAGGMESNSLMPERYYAKKDPRRGEGERISVAEFSPFHDGDLRKAATQLAYKYEVEKKQMRSWTLRSHQLAASFLNSLAYGQYVLPFNKATGKDETLRTSLNENTLKKVESAELIDRTNTAHFHDGAGLVLMGTENTLKMHGLPVLAKIVDISIVGISPDQAPEGCITAAAALLKNNGLDSNDIDLFEVNESFAVKPLAFMKHFGLDDSKVNVYGGNLAMGHPYAASGIINILNMVLALKEKRLKFGLVSAGIAGGYGAAILLENAE